MTRSKKAGKAQRVNAQRQAKAAAFAREATATGPTNVAATTKRLEGLGGCKRRPVNVSVVAAATTTQLRQLQALVQRIAGLADAATTESMAQLDAWCADVAAYGSASSALLATLSALARYRHRHVCVPLGCCGCVTEASECADILTFLCDGDDRSGDAPVEQVHAAITAIKAAALLAGLRRAEAVSAPGASRADDDDDDNDDDDDDDDEDNDDDDDGDDDDDDDVRAGMASVRAAIDALARRVDSHLDVVMHETALTAAQWRRVEDINKVRLLPGYKAMLTRLQSRATACFHNAVDHSPALSTDVRSALIRLLAPLHQRVAAADVMRAARDVCHVRILTAAALQEQHAAAAAQAAADAQRLRRSERRAGATTNVGAVVAPMADTPATKRQRRRRQRAGVRAVIGTGAGITAQVAELVDEYDGVEYDGEAFLD